MVCRSWSADATLLVNVLERTGVYSQDSYSQPVDGVALINGSAKARAPEASIIDKVRDGTPNSGEWTKLSVRPSDVSGGTNALPRLGSGLRVSRGSATSRK